MVVVIGNKKVKISAGDFRNLAKNFDRVVLDIGTGDGRFVYKNALKNPTTLFIGMDPAEKQLEIYSKKAIRKKLKNALFVVGSIENTPTELFDSVNKIFITLPWGTLLENIVKTNEKLLKNLWGMLKNSDDLEIIFGYVPELEPSETERLNLPNIDADFIKGEFIPSFEKLGFQLKIFTKVEKKELGKTETTWAKKLKFGKERKIYKTTFSKRAG